MNHVWELLKITGPENRGRKKGRVGDRANISTKTYLMVAARDGLSVRDEHEMPVCPFTKQQTI